MTKPAHEQFAEKMVRLLMWEADNSGFTPADLSDQVGGSPRTYENYKYTSMPTLAGFFGMLRAVQPHQVAKKVAEQCGGYFVYLPDDGHLPLPTLAKQTSEIMKKTADVINTVAKSLEGESPYRDIAGYGILGAAAIEGKAE